MKKAAGFTLLEIVLALVAAGLFLACFAPRFLDTESGSASESVQARPMPHTPPPLSSGQLIYPPPGIAATTAPDAVPDAQALPQTGEGDLEPGIAMQMRRGPSNGPIGSRNGTATRPFMAAQPDDVTYDPPE